MRTLRFVAFFAAAVVAASAFAQSTNLTRAEVAAVKAKLVAIQAGMGEPTGHGKDNENYNLPTESSLVRDGRFWPVGASVNARYTDKGYGEGVANAEKAALDLQTKYAAAIASGDVDAYVKMAEELNKVTQMAAAVGMSPRKEDMTVDIQLNANPYARIDPDAVVFESAGVIALREANLSSTRGRVVVYVDPVALRETETLSSFEIRTPEDGVANKTGVYNIRITLDGTLADAEAWANGFDRAAILGTIDPL